MININHSGSFKNTENFFKRVLNSDHGPLLHKHGDAGVRLLQANTPVNTGKTANSWSYKIINKKNRLGIEWYNDSVTKNGTPIVILLQYGHATGSGGYVQGYDFINPSIRPIFNSIADEIWKEVIGR